MSDKSRVYIEKADRKALLRVLEGLLDKLALSKLAGKETRIVIKPNLCTDRLDSMEVANTLFEVSEAVCQAGRQVSSNVTIVESDGLRYTTEQAFQNMGLYEMGEKLGVKLVNLSKDETVPPKGEWPKDWPMARTYMEAEVFITLPKIKTHATTVFTGALKNQWGCVPQFNRVLLHKHLDQLLAEINRLRPVTVTIMDGIIAMEGRGPVNGPPVPVGAMLAGRDPVAVDATSMRLVGLDPFKSKHVVLASEIGVGVVREEDIEVIGPFDELHHVIEPARMDWAIKIMNLVSRSRFLTDHLIINDTIFYPLRKAVNLLRSSAK